MVWFHVPLEPDERRDSEVTGPRRCPWNNLSSLLTVSTVQASDFPLPLFNPPSRNLDRHRWPVLRRVAVAARPAAMAPEAPKGPLQRPLHSPSAALTEPRHRCPTEFFFHRPRCHLRTEAPQALQTGQRSMAGLVRWAAAPVVVDTPPLRTRDPLGPGRRGRKTATGWLRPRRPRRPSEQSGPSPGPGPGAP